MIMKRIIVMGAIAALLLSGFGSYAAQSDDDPAADSAKAPAIYIPVSQWNFEPVVDGTSVVHDFAVQNKGDAPLNISKVKTG